MNKQGVLNLYKRVGETPLRRIERLRREDPAYAETPVTYVGRLDPMAEGVLVALAGEDRFRRHEFMSLDKEYEFDALWGFTSDTFDILGRARFERLPAGLPELVPGILGLHTGEIVQKYPPYSSKPVDGKPLFHWARLGTLRNEKIPSKLVRVKRLEHLGTRHVAADELLAEVARKIALVEGDFRQEEAASSWKKAISRAGANEFAVSTFSAAVSSGTYVRGLVDSFGKEAGCGALTLRILRTRVGELTIDGSV